MTWLEKKNAGVRVRDERRQAYEVREEPAVKSLSMCQGSIPPHPVTSPNFGAVVADASNRAGGGRV